MKSGTGSSAGAGRDRAEDLRQLRLRYAGVCCVCAEPLPRGTAALHSPSRRTVRCLPCSPSSRTDAPTPLPLSIDPEVWDSGLPGAGAQREYERRRARDEARTWQRWGRFGGIAVALSQEKQSTAAWSLGAEGERRIGARLDALADQLGGLVLHDRKIPGSRANIDHILILPHGLWVIDAKNYRGKVEIRRSGGVLTPRVEKLTVRGRDCTSLVEQSLRRVELVRRTMPGVPVIGVLCFYGAEWPVGGHLRTRGVEILWPRRIKRVVRARSSATIDVSSVGVRLAACFPAAA